MDYVLACYRIALTIYIIREPSFEHEETLAIIAITNSDNFETLIF